MTRIGIPLVCAALGLAGSAFPEDKANDGPYFTLRTADGENVQGPLRSLEDGWSMRVGAGNGKRVAGANVLSLRRQDVPLPHFPTDAQLFLHGGSRIPASKVRVANERLIFHHPDIEDGREISLPLSSLALYWQAAPLAGGHAEAYSRRAVQGTHERDQLVLRNGDVLDGVLSMLDAKQAAFEIDQKTRMIDKTQVAALAFSTELAQPLRAKGPFALVTLLGGPESRGTRIALRSGTLNAEGQLEGRTFFDAQLQVPLERVAAVDIFQGKAVYLSDLRPTRYEHQPFFDAGWPLGTDCSATWRDLRLAGGVFAKGLGMHSRTRVTYALAEPFRRFEALVGLDEITGRRGSVRLRVHVNREPVDLGRAGEELTFKRGAMHLSVPLKGARELTLEVDFGENGDVEDHVNWADAMLVR